MNFIATHPFNAAARFNEKLLEGINPIDYCDKPRNCGNPKGYLAEL